MTPLKKIIDEQVPKFHAGQVHENSISNMHKKTRAVHKYKLLSLHSLLNI